MLLLDLGQKTDQAIKVLRGENKPKFVAWPVIAAFKICGSIKPLLLIPSTGLNARI